MGKDDYEEEDEGGVGVGGFYGCITGVLYSYSYGGDRVMKQKK
jgi:hypothetical protein